MSNEIHLNGADSPSRFPSSEWRMEVEVSTAPSATTPTFTEEADHD